MIIRRWKRWRMYSTSVAARLTKPCPTGDQRWFRTHWISGVKDPRNPVLEGRRERTGYLWVQDWKGKVHANRSKGKSAPRPATMLSAALLCPDAPCNSRNQMGQQPRTSMNFQTTCIYSSVPILCFVLAGLPSSTPRSCRVTIIPTSLQTTACFHITARFGTPLRSSVMIPGQLLRRFCSSFSAPRIQPILK